jgi:AAA15 family ATPase/GTPase
MLTTVRVQNYKSWQDSGDIALAELTGFFGANGTGKTALLEAIWEQNRNAPNVCYFEKGDILPPSEAAARWLVENAIIHSYRQDGERLFIKKNEKAPELPVEAAGTGLARTFAVTNLCFSAPAGATLLFEQPDRGIHQSVQTLLADLFIEAVTVRNIQIIFESHSESLVHRLQRRIGEELFSNECTKLYQIDLNVEGYSHVNLLNLDKYGSIHNWPRDFFGNPLGEGIAQNKARLNRLLAEERQRKPTKGTEKREKEAELNTHGKVEAGRR